MICYDASPNGLKVMELMISHVVNHDVWQTWQ